MNPNYTEFKFPQIKANPWHKIFCKCMLLEAVDLVSRLLQYSPNLRCTVLDSNVYSSYLTLLRKNKKTFKVAIFVIFFAYIAGLLGISCRVHSTCHARYSTQ